MRKLTLSPGDLLLFDPGQASFDFSSDGRALLGDIAVDVPRMALAIPAELAQRLTERKRSFVAKIDLDKHRRGTPADFFLSSLKYIYIYRYKALQCEGSFLRFWRGGFFRHKAKEGHRQAPGGAAACASAVGSVRAGGA